MQQHSFSLRLCGVVLGLSLCISAKAAAEPGIGAYDYYNKRGVTQTAPVQLAALNTNGAFKNYFSHRGRVQAAASVAHRGPLVAPGKIVRGSGFYIGPDAVLTNAHIADKCLALTVNDNVRAPAYAEYIDRKRDIALIRTHQRSSVWASVNPSASLAKGAPVSVAGYPTENSVYPRYSHFEAEITRNETDARGDGRVLFSKGVLKGNSGGPVIADNGTVVGMVTGRVRLMFASAAGAGFEEAQTSGIAVSGAAIGRFLRKSPKPVAGRESCAGAAGYCGPVTDPAAYTVKITCRK